MAEKGTAWWLKLPYTKLKIKISYLKKYIKGRPMTISETLNHAYISLITNGEFKNHIEIEVFHDKECLRPRPNLILVIDDVTSLEIFWPNEKSELLHCDRLIRGRYI
ncbi:MAG: hypothetical protein Q7S73_00570 [bacterium]|nr:hypothetical protein [bacterium]